MSDEDKSELVRQIEALRDAQFHDLDYETKAKLLKGWVAVDHRMRQNGQDRPVWDGNFPMVDLLNNEVVIKTDKGEQVGKAIYSLPVEDTDGVVKQGLLVHIPSSGSIYIVPGRNVRPATNEDRQTMQRHITYAKILSGSNESIEVITKEKRSRRVAGTHLLSEMMSRVSDRKLVVEDKSGFHKIFGNKKGICVYLAIKGGRADLSGFCIDHPAVKPLSEQEAKEKHLGKVRGQIDFNRDDKTVLEGWNIVLDALG